MTAVFSWRIKLYVSLILMWSNTVYCYIGQHLFVQFHSSKYSEHSQQMKVFGGPVVFFSLSCSNKGCMTKAHCYTHTLEDHIYLHRTEISLLAFTWWPEFCMLPPYLEILFCQKQPVFCMCILEGLFPANNIIYWKCHLFKNRLVSPKFV